MRTEGSSALETLTAAVAARRHFLDGSSKSELAAELGISRFKVARLLEAARRNGIVRIEVDAPPEIDLDLSRAVAERHGLRGALVVRTSDGTDEFRREQLGRVGAELLRESLETTDVVGISWGRTLHALVGHLAGLSACTVVQIVGSVPTLELNANSLELVRRVAECSGGPVYPLHVPLIVDDPDTAAGLRRDPFVGRTLDMYGRLTRAVVGIGSWTASGSTVRAALPGPLAAELDAAGAVADVCSAILDCDGREVASPAVLARFIAISAAQLRAVPDVLAIAGGADKAVAIAAALRSGLIHRLITDERAARSLLAA